MPDYDYAELFPGRFIQAGLLKGKAVTLTISNIELEKMPDSKAKNGERVRGILSFRERDLQLVLNKTNGECLKGMFGRRTGAWVGKRITIFPRMVDAFGGQELAIRILGSPDIKKDFRVELNLGRRRGYAVMKRTTAGVTPAPTPEPELTEEPLDEEYNPETGELHSGNGASQEPGSDG